MSQLLDFPDPDDMLRTRLLAGGFDLAPSQVGTRMPDPTKEFGETLPYVRLESLRDNASELEARPVIDVEVFARTSREAKSLSRSIQTALLGYAQSVKVGEREIVMAKSSSLGGPARLPYDDSKVARVGATYQLSIRR